MKMWNIFIEVTCDNYFVVIADSERFGKEEVMFEGNTFNQCFNYLKRELGVESLALRADMLMKTYTDREGRTFPIQMRVDV